MVNNLNQCVNQLETKIVTAENKIIDKVKNKIVDNVNKHLNPSFAEGWEMIYDSTTKIVSHIQQLKKSK